MRIYAYKLGSKTAKEVAKILKTQIVKPDGEFRNNFNHKVVNWGATELPKWKHTPNTFLNHPLNVRKAVNKIVTLQTMLENNIPHIEFTSDKNIAQSWLPTPVIVRRIVNGYGGRGVTLVTEGELPDAPLYTKFIPKAREYRFHVFEGRVIDVQQKKRRSNVEERQDGVIKNLSNGWVFCRDDITEPPSNARDVAVAAIRALGLDFGSVDLLSKNGEVFVLEVNTASGLQGTTLDLYINELKRYGRNNI